MKLLINQDDSIGVEITDLAHLLDAVIDFTSELFLGLPKEETVKILNNHDFDDYAGIITYKNGYNDQVKGNVHAYSKALKKLDEAKSYDQASKALNDLNQVFKNLNSSLLFKLSE
ncbi:MAG: hypothetical protein K6G28_02135 [Acholeplasmatales bacterium]|nr:hypothetical protein [Acholeplasmatales bacterium]